MLLPVCRHRRDHRSISRNHLFNICYRINRFSELRIVGDKAALARNDRSLRHDPLEDGCCRTALVPIGNGDRSFVVEQRDLYSGFVVVEFDMAKLLPRLFERNFAKLRNLREIECKSLKAAV